MMPPQSNRSQVPVVNIVSYSYKGGSGRSTASVNIAFKLAKMGKLVVVLDMDIGAAGMHMIMSEWNSSAKAQIDNNKEGRVGHQTFFNGTYRTPDDILAMLGPAMLNVEQVDETYFKRNRTEGDDGPVGALMFVFSSAKDRSLKDLSGGPAGATLFEQKYLLLQQTLARKLGGSIDREVYFIVDSPNGITPVSLPVLTGADLILMFYRHSLQHIRGTIEAGERLHYYLMEEFDRRFMRILLVGSCVPERIINGLRKSSKSGALASEQYATEMLEKFDTMSVQLSEFEARYPGLVRRLDAELIEDDVLKVLDQPLDDDGVLNELLGYPRDEANLLSSTQTQKKIAEIAESIVEYGQSIARRKNMAAGVGDN